MNNILNMELSRDILDKFNKGEIGKEKPIAVKAFPSISNPSIINLTEDYCHKIFLTQLDAFMDKYNVPKNLLDLESKLKCPINPKETIFLTKQQLYAIGVYLYPFFSYGILNGGSATSYVDINKNNSLDKNYFNKYKSIFISLSKDYKNKPKGITPAFINPNKSLGPSFIEIKLRKLLLQGIEYSNITNRETKNLFPVFQMTSHSTNTDIKVELLKYKNSLYLRDLIDKTGINITNIKTGIQPLITAYTHSKFGPNKDLFYDQDRNLLPLPGGHGQCFMILKDIFMDLYKDGIRFISIGNIDNIGYNLDPIELALFALSNKQAAFDFSFKTKYDTKGGVLVIDENNKLNCGDMGVAVDPKEIKTMEDQNNEVLFNCASGLFNLKYIIDNIDYISKSIPTRFSDQSKDIGDYSQAEQVTWEIIGILDTFIIFAINKYDRFLASKLLVENLATSGLIDESLPESLQEWSQNLYNGLVKKLIELDLELKDGKWIPKK